MRRAVWGLIVLLVALFVEARRADADFRVCNTTPFLIEAAFGYTNLQHRLISQGWLQINAGACSVVLGGPLKQRHVYLYAKGTGQYSKVRYSGTTPFCIQQPKFTLYRSQYGDSKQEDCAAWGLTSANFIDIDTQGKANWSHKLWYSGVAQAPRPNPPPSSFTPQPTPGYVPPAPGRGGDGGSACQRFPNLC